MATRVFLVILVLALLAGGPMAGDRAPAETAETEAAPSAGTGVPWTELRFVARKFLLSARATLKVRTVSALETDGRLLAAPEGTGRRLSTPFLIETRIISDLPFGRGEETRAWLEPGGAVLQSEKQGTGKKRIRQRRRYTAAGYYSWRSEPADSRERKLGPEEWSRRDNRLITVTPPPVEDVAVTSSYALLYLISAARLDRAETRLRLHVFSRGDLLEVEFSAGSLSRLSVSFDESCGDDSRRRQEEISVREVFGAPVGDGSDVKMGLMGMRGPLRIFVEEGTGIPVEIRGRADHLGEITVRLERAVLASPPALPRMMKAE